MAAGRFRRRMIIDQANVRDTDGNRESFRGDLAPGAGR